MATGFIGIALEDTAQSILTKVGEVDTNVSTVKSDVAEVKSDVGTVKTDVGGVSTQVTNQAETLATINTNAANAATNASNAASNASTAATNASNAYSQAQTNASTLSTINTNVSNIKSTVSTINTNTAASASADGCAKVLNSLAALDNNNLRYDSLLNGIVMNHSAYGWIEMVAIAFNVDGANYVTLKAAGPIDTSAWGTSGQDWKNCTARTWCRGTFYNGIPTALKNKIKTVTKKVYTRAGSIGSNSETVWLLSATELGAAGSGGGGVAEGAPYAYFNGSRALGASTMLVQQIPFPMTLYHPKVNYGALLLRSGVKHPLTQYLLFIFIIFRRWPVKGRLRLAIRHIGVPAWAPGEWPLLTVPS